MIIKIANETKDLDWKWLLRSRKNQSQTIENLIKTKINLETKIKIKIKKEKRDQNSLNDIEVRKSYAKFTIKKKSRLLFQKNMNIFRISTMI